MKQFLLILFISVFSISQMSAKEKNTKVSELNSNSVVLLSNDNIKLNLKSEGVLVLNKKAFKNKINLKLKGQIELFRVKKKIKLC